MKAETFINGLVGVTGTTLAWVSSADAAIVCGLSTAAWMLWQLGTSIYDRLRKK